MQKISFGTKLMFGAVCAATLAITGYCRWLNIVPTVSIPTPPLPSPNGFDALCRASNREVEASQVSTALGLEFGSGLHCYSIVELQHLVSENAAALSAARRALRLPYLNPPDRSTKTSFQAQMKFRDLARLFVLESRVRAARGDYAGAVDSCLDAIELGVTIPRGGVLISELIGEGCESIACKEIWPLIDKLRPGNARLALRRLTSILAKRGTFAETIREEEMYGRSRYIADFMNESTFALYGKRMAEARGIGGDNAPRTITASQTISDYKLLSNRSKSRILADYSWAMEAYEAGADLPLHVPLSEISVANDPLNQDLVANLEPFRYESARTRVHGGLLLCAMALRVYQDRHGDYPATLEGLVKEHLLKQIPEDLFSPHTGAPPYYDYWGTWGSRYRYQLFCLDPDGLNNGTADSGLASSMPITRCLLPEREQDHRMSVDLGGLEPKFMHL